MIWEVVEWIIVVSLATIATYLSFTITIPAFKDGPSGNSGISFLSVYFAKFMASLVFLTPLLLILYGSWPKFRNDLHYRLQGAPIKYITIGIGLALAAQVFFGRAYRLGLSVETTRIMSALIAIAVPIIYKCCSKTQSKQWNPQVISGLILLGISTVILVTDDLYNQ